MSDQLFVEDSQGDHSLTQVVSTREIPVVESLDPKAVDATEHADLPFLTAAFKQKPPRKSGGKGKMSKKQHHDESVQVTNKPSDSDIDSVDQDYIDNLDQLELNEYVFQIVDSDDFESFDEAQSSSDSESDEDSAISSEEIDIDDELEEETLHLENLSKKDRKKSKAVQHALKNVGKTQSIKVFYLEILLRFINMIPMCRKRKATIDWEEEE